jgi:hypothetical protein
VGWFSAGPLTGVFGLLILLITPIVADQWAKTLSVHIAGPLALVLAIASFGLPLIFSRYFIMLGASNAAAGSRDRAGYDALRESLVTGGLATRLYARWLTAFLDRVDRFFGDAGMADRTLFPHAFGLRTPAPLWTAPAFDRCLLLGLFYPITTILVMWAVSGHVGPAENVLALPRGYSGWTRGLHVAAVGFIAFAYWRFAQTRGWIRAIWLAAAIVALAAIIVDIIADEVAGGFAGLGLFSIAAAFTGGAATFASVITLSVAYVYDTGSNFVYAIGQRMGIDDGFFLHVIIPGAMTVAVTVGIGAAIAWLSKSAIRNRRQGEFLLSFFVATFLSCLVAAHSLSHFLGWRSAVGGPLLLFLGLLTLLNAPFDWASLGLTRALLRRGLELKGWWPFFLAVADALAAAVIIALLAIAMVIGVQTFDAVAVHGGGEPVLPLISGTIASGLVPYRIPLLDRIAAHPEAPEYWWVYALLLSTMIPSLINLAIGGTALVRAVPGVPSLLLSFLPATGGVAAYDRAWIAAVLTLQAGFGAILGVAVQALVAWGLILYAMPAAGLGLLDLARGLAALDLPARVIAFFVGAP